MQKSHYHSLKKAWLRRHAEAKADLHKKHKEAFDYVVDKFPAKDKLASGAAGMLMLSSVIPSPVVLDAVAAFNLQTKEETQAPVFTKDQMLSEINLIVGDKARELNSEEETKLASTLSKYYGMNISPDVGGLRLNRTYGVIGAEQHLMRYPGDTMATHLTSDEAKDKMVYSSGMAPGRGAWGYFVSSKGEMTQKDVERERWYIAVQTFAAPNYNERLSEYRDFFKFRKMLVVNAKTGEAIVVVIGDAGPAKWTGKHLGGAPEVMYHLGYGKGSRKGPVLYFFINDPDDQTPLGPVEL